MPALTARLTACGSGGLTPGRSSAAAASAHASIALWSSVLVMKSRPRSTTMPRKPISTAREIPTRTRTPPFSRDRTLDDTFICSLSRRWLGALPRPAPGTDIDYRESRGGRLERSLILADRVDGGRAVDAGDRIRVA